MYHILFWEDHLTALGLRVLGTVLPMLVDWLITAMNITAWLLGLVVLSYVGVFALVFWILANVFHMLYDLLFTVLLAIFDILFIHNSMFFE